MIKPGDKLPEFSVKACVSTEVGKEFGNVQASDFKGKWLVLYTYPKDFTFICPTEIVEFDRNRAEFEKRGAKLVGGSTDNEHSHLAWRLNDEQLGKLTHPLIHIPPTLAAALDLIHPSAGVALRVTLIVDPEGVVRFSSANDLDVGRNVPEILRVLDALQAGGRTACNWKPGDKLI